VADAFAPITDRLDRYATALTLHGPAGATFERVAGPILKEQTGIAAKAAFGVDLKPWKNKTVRAGFGYDRMEIPAGIRIVIKLRPQGVWAFGEHGSKPHRIGGKKGKRKRRVVVYVKGAKYGHPVAGVDHPGSTGKGAIRYVFKLVRTAQADAARQGVRAVLEGVSRV